MLLAGADGARMEWIGKCVGVELPEIRLNVVCYFYLITGGEKSSLEWCVIVLKFSDDFFHK